MLDLTERQHALLTRISRAGAAGHELQQGEIADACRMGSAGLCTLARSRAVITEKGRGFLLRVVA